MSTLQDERRRYKRFKVKEESSFILTSEWPTLGEVLDISEGGLAFTYVDEKEWPSELPQGSMVFGNHDSCLNDLPMRLVSDRVIDTVSHGNKLVVRRRCVEFCNLSKEQKFLLECFIWINGVAES